MQCSMQVKGLLARVNGAKNRKKYPCGMKWLSSSKPYRGLLTNTSGARLQ